MSELKIIARIFTDFPSKFGVPRQSGLADTCAEIIFEPAYRNPDALRGIEEYSHLWLIWGFSENEEEENRFRPTVRPPRLGGNTRVGVFASRSPFRPNPIGLSCVRLEGLEKRDGSGVVLHVTGADVVSGTPVYDIKPYLPYVDSYPDAKGSFAEQRKEYRLNVEIEEKQLVQIPEEHRETLREILAQDPRPSYQNDPDRIYGMEYAGMEIKFRVKEKKLIVCEVERS